MLLYLLSFLMAIGKRAMYISKGIRKINM